MSDSIELPAGSGDVVRRKRTSWAPIVIVGAIFVAGAGGQDTLTQVIGFIAVVLASANVVGGFVVTDRMLEMFKKKEPAKKADEAGAK